MKYKKMLNNNNKTKTKRKHKKDIRNKDTNEKCEDEKGKSKKRNGKFISKNLQTSTDVKDAVFNTFLNGENNQLICMKYKDVEIKRDKNNKGYNVEDLDLKKFQINQTFCCGDCKFTTLFISAFKVHFIMHANTYFIVDNINKTLQMYFCYICNKDCDGEIGLNKHLEFHKNDLSSNEVDYKEEYLLDSDEEQSLLHLQVKEEDSTQQQPQNDVKKEFPLEDDDAPFDDDNWQFSGDNFIKTEIDDSDDQCEKNECFETERNVVKREIENGFKFVDALHETCFVQLERTTDLVATKECTEKVYADKIETKPKEERINAIVNEVKCDVCDCKIEYGKICDHGGKKTRLCPLCNKVFLFYRYNHHRKLHYCSKCSFESSDIQKVAEHKKESKECWYDCQKCNFKTFNEQSFKRHSKNGCSIKSINVLECDLCSYRTYYKTNIKKHIKTNHGSGKGEISDDYKCQFCKVVCLQEKNLKLHLNKHYCGNCTFVSPSVEAVVQHRKDNSDCLLKCSACSFQTALPTSLRGHRYKSICTNKKGFGKEIEGDVVKKKKRKNCPTLHCDSCSYRSHSKFHLSRHIEKTHLYPKSYQCSLCGSTFKNISQLNKHEKTHIDGKAYKCKVCGFECHQEKYFMIHKKKHSEEEYRLKELSDVKDPRFIYCDKCEFRTKYQSSFKIHLLKHDNIRPFLCPICGLSFFSAKDYSGHKNIVHKKKATSKKLFKCKYCSYTYNQKITILVHERKHTGEKPLSCEFCSYKTGYPGNLRAHRKRHLLEKLKQGLSN